jgi:hypothetical protein
MSSAQDIVTRDPRDRALRDLSREILPTPTRRIREQPGVVRWRDPVRAHHEASIGALDPDEPASLSRLWRLDWNTRPGWMGQLYNGLPDQPELMPKVHLSIIVEESELPSMSVWLGSLISAYHRGRPAKDPPFELGMFDSRKIFLSGLDSIQYETKRARMALGKA